jgi:hypothetical protein
MITRTIMENNIAFSILGAATFLAVTAIFGIICERRNNRK